jgi:hypothetical protein
MDIISHTLNWCKGEVFEGKMSLLFGVCILLISMAYFKWASTPGARAMFIPLLTIALLAIGAGIYLVNTNQKRMPRYEIQFKENPQQFIKSEKKRTAAFIKWYPITQKIFFAIMILGMLCMLLSNAPNIRAIGIALMLLSVYVFVLDHFSEERATFYYSKIVELSPN